MTPAIVLAVFYVHGRFDVFQFVLSSFDAKQPEQPRDVSLISYRRGGRVRM
jgi:hypothetical protein